MGNSGSHTGHISSGSRFEGLSNEQTALKSLSKVGAHVKVLPNSEPRQRLRHTNNGDILQSGGTLSRFPVPQRNASPKPYLPTQRFSLQKNDDRTSSKTSQYASSQTRQYASSQNMLNSQVKLYKSEPDLRLPSSLAPEMKEKRTKKKYKAPPPPSGKTEANSSNNWEEDVRDEYAPRKTRLFKTRIETKKESSQINKSEQIVESNYDDLDEKIIAKQHIIRPNRLSLPEFNLLESIDFQTELKEATKRIKESALETVDQKAADRHKDSSDESRQGHSAGDQGPDTDRRFIRGEPSGKESSISELSPVLRAPEGPKPRVFYFGMEKEDSDVSSNYQVDEEDEHSTIALRLRPVLPRRPPQIPHFSPAAAWRLLDARSQDSGISGDARPPLSSSWTPQQDLGDDSSLEEVRRELPKLLSRHRPHVFSLSLPRDLQPAAFTTISSNKTGISSLRRLKRSVSGVVNTLSTRKDAEHRSFSRDQADVNWFLSCSAPNSINEISPDIAEFTFPHISRTSRLIYLPENNNTKIPSVESNKYQLSAFSKSCEELKMPESLRDPKSVLDFTWTKEEPSKKQRKFTFQSTFRQIERRRMAEKLSREAEKKEKQRLKEVEAMRRVEEEFQRKRAKEKANIRQQLRLYAMDESQWTSLPFEDNEVKLEERQEPEGALSSSTPSPASVSKYHEGYDSTTPLESKRTTHATQELSEYRQVQRDYKEYPGMTKLGADSRNYRQTTIHPEVTYNMPYTKGSNHERGNYRRDFAYGMKSSKSIDSNHSEHSYKMYRNKYLPTTRF